MTDLNCRPPPCKGDALPTELIAQYIISKSLQTNNQYLLTLVYNFD